MTERLLVNFGGPRDLDEIEPFLRALLCDKDVIRTRFPPFFHDWLFRRVARKRALSLLHDYRLIGGRSPIFSDTEALGRELGALTFHRYLPATHAESLQKIEASPAGKILVLPLFPQFTYATTGSIARFFSRSLTPCSQNKLRWIKSYPAHPSFAAAFQTKIRSFLTQNCLPEEETCLLFSPHGLPQAFIDEGDPYRAECELSFRAILKAFPNALGRLSYQSKFGRGEWLRPYTNEVCEQVLDWHEGRKNIVFVPLSFPSDHIETLFEVERLYLPLIRAKGLRALRCPALNLEPYWIDALNILFQETSLSSNDALIRNLPGKSALGILPS